MDTNNYNLGKYVAYAFHEPNKYPDQPFLTSKKKHTEVMSGADMERTMLTNTIKLGGKIK